MKFARSMMADQYTQGRAIFGLDNGVHHSGNRTASAFASASRSCVRDESGTAAGAVFGRWCVEDLVDLVGGIVIYTSHNRTLNQRLGQGASFEPRRGGRS